MHSLGEIGNRRATELLRRAKEDSRKDVREAASRALKELEMK